VLGTRFLVALAVVLPGACLSLPERPPGGDASTALVPCDEATPCAGPDAQCHCSHCAYPDLECPASALRYATAGGPGGECVPAATQLDVGWQHVCARWSNGRVSCWGWNCDGQLGNHPDSLDCDPDPLVSVVPVLVRESPGGPPLGEVAAVVTGILHTCARRVDRTVWCWGGNQQGQLGSGSEDDRSLAPVQVVREDGSPLTDIASITAGHRHTCALDRAGSVFCWGSNGRGQLGVSDWTGEGTGDRRTRAVRVDSPGAFSRIAAGGEHTCGALPVADEGPPDEAWCWGRNNLGQLGHLDSDGQSRPTPVKALQESDDQPVAPLTHLALGQHFSMAALNLPPRILGWGQNAWHALGDGSNPDGDDGLTAWKARPVELDLLAPPMQLAAGSNFATVVLQNGILYSWGGNAFGQLGRDLGEAWSTPGVVMEGVASAAAGFEQACAITSDGRLLCWGDNRSGQLGDGTRTNRATPTAVQELCQ
jgi:hypothetical protein